MPLLKKKSDLVDFIFYLFLFSYTMRVHVFKDRCVQNMMKDTFLLVLYSVSGRLALRPNIEASEYSKDQNITIYYHGSLWKSN